MGRADWFPWSTAASTESATKTATPSITPTATPPSFSSRTHHANDSQSSLGSSLSDLSLSSSRTETESQPLPTDLGTLIVVVMKAKNLYNRRAISKQNPYCSVRVANHSDRTKAIVRGGQAPVWDHEARFRLNLEDDCRSLKLCVFDQNGSNTEIIGDAMIPLKPAMDAPSKQGHDSWYPIHYNKRYVGEVYLEMTFYPFKRKSARSSRRSSHANLASSTYLNLKHSESMPTLRALDLPSYMGTRPSRSPSPTGRRNSRPLPQVPDDEQLSLGIPEPLSAPWASKVPDLPTIHSDAPRPSDVSTGAPATAAAASPNYIPANLPPSVPPPPMPSLPVIPALDETADVPPTPPRHASSVPTLPPMKTAQEDIFKQINDRYEASLFERLRPPASRPS